MKKILKMLLCMLCTFNMLALTNVFAQNEDDFSGSVIKSELTAEQIVSENVEGYEIRKISRSELINLYSETYEVSNDIAITMVNNDYPITTRSVDTNYYVIEKSYSLKFITSGSLGTTGRHQVVVSMYSSGSFFEIRGASACAVLLTGMDFTWEAGINTQNYTSKSVTWFSTGNLLYTTSQSLGASFAGFLSASVGNNFYYRKYFELSSSKTY